MSAPTPTWSLTIEAAADVIHQPNDGEGAVILDCNDPLCPLSMALRFIHGLLNTPGMEGGIVSAVMVHRYDDIGHEVTDDLLARSRTGTFA